MDKEQIRILKELDIGASLKRVGKVFIPSNSEIALAGLHKARYMLRNSKLFSEEEIERSSNWLINNNYEVLD